MIDSKTLEFMLLGVFRTFSVPSVSSVVNRLSSYILSKIPAAPMPPPMHIETIP